MGCVNAGLVNVGGICASSCLVLISTGSRVGRDSRRLPPLSPLIVPAAPLKREVVQFILSPLATLFTLCTSIDCGLSVLLLTGGGGIEFDLEDEFVFRDAAAAL